MKQPKKAVEPGSFVDVVAGYRSGQLLKLLNEKYTEAAQEAAKMRKPASITLTLVLKPESIGRGFDLEADVSTKLPRPKLKASTAFIGDDGRLYREDPAQGEMFEDVEHDPSTGQVIGEGPGEQPPARPNLRAVE